MTANDTVNIAAFLPRMAAKRPHAPAIFFPQGRDAAGRVAYTHLSYRQLDQASDHIARGLGEIGIERGMRTVLMVKPSLDFFALTFALFKAGIVPVMIDPGIGLKSLKTCLAEARPEAFIGIPAAHIARIVFGWAKHSNRINVTVSGRLFQAGHTLAQVQRLGVSVAGAYTPAPTRTDELAAILFTSGSTGIPKGVEYTHGNFAAQVEMIRATYDIQPGEIDVPTFPLFGLFDPALGMTTVIPDMDARKPARVDPEKIFKAIDDFGASNLFGSPALLNRIARHAAASGVRLSSLKRVLSAGAPVPPQVLTLFSKLLPADTEIFTPYGATEALPVASIGSAEILGETAAKTAQGYGNCVGRVVAGMHVFIIKISDQPIKAFQSDLLLPPGEIGEIVVRGPTVTRAYFNRDDSTQLAKMHDDAGRLYHRMGDLGYFDEHGRLWFCGRKAHRVETPEQAYYSIPVEGVFNTHPRVFRTALVGLRRNAVTIPALCVELEKDARTTDQDQITQELRKLGAAHEHTRAIEHFFYHSSFPVDVRHNAKIIREKLAPWAQKRLT